MINLGKLCFQNPGLVVHELGHVLGLWHEQNRPDRNRFIEVIWENVAKGRESLFYRQRRKEVQSFYSMYDYGSIMHYQLNAFSKNGKPTLRPKQKFSGIIGQRDSPSDSDYLQLRYLYGCQRCEFFLTYCVYHHIITN